MREEASSAFLTKSAQKTFAKLCRAGFTATGPVDESFLLLFFNKEALASSFWGARHD
jgi:hypothetical protein